MIALATTQEVSFLQIAACPSNRLDAKHHMPVHRTWEHFFPNEVAKTTAPSRDEVVKAFLCGLLPESEFVKATKVRDQRTVIPPREVDARYPQPCSFD